MWGHDYLSLLQQYVFNGQSAYTVAFYPDFSNAPATLAEAFSLQIVDNGAAAWSALDRLGSNQEHHICRP